MAAVLPRRLRLLARAGSGLRASRRALSDGAAAEDGALRRLAALAESDPAAVSRVQRSLSARTLAALERAVGSEAVAAARTEIPVPTRRQLMLVTLAPMPLFIAFGFIDNAVMILAGETFDKTLGVTFGISTMAAAALGNLVSDVLGLGVGGIVEEWFERAFGKDPGLTRAQEGLAVVRRARFAGNAVGVSIGCLIGMFPLLFMDFDSIARRKRLSRMDELFATVMEFVSDAMEVETAILYVVDKKAGELWTKAAVGNSAQGQLVRFPLNQGVVGHCATSGDVVNTSDPEALQRFGSNANAVTGQQQRNVLCTPVFGRDGEIIGVLQICNRSNNDEFRVKDEVALTAMSSHISCALESAFAELNGEEGMTNKEQLLRALSASVEHHNHHLRYLTSRADGAPIELID